MLDFLDVYDYYVYFSQYFDLEACLILFYICYSGGTTEYNSYRLVTKLVQLRSLLSQPWSI